MSFNVFTDFFSNPLKLHLKRQNTSVEKLFKNRNVWKSPEDASNERAIKVTAQVIAATASYLLTFIAIQNARAANCNFPPHSKDIVARRKTVGGTWFRFRHLQKIISKGVRRVTYYS